MICGPYWECSRYRLPALGYRSGYRQVLSLLAVACSLLPLFSCAGRPVQYTVVVPTVAEAISLLGDTLWSLPLDP